jgi:hypothetical protein
MTVTTPRTRHAALAILCVLVGLGLPALARAGRAGSPTIAGGPAATSAKARLKVEVLTKSATAATARKGKTIRVKLRSSEKITKLRGALLTAKVGETDVFAVGRVKRLKKGKSTLSLKVSRTPSRGSYSLVLAGVRSNRTRGNRSVTFQIK